jgi:hypothetical protein
VWLIAQADGRVAVVTRPGGEALKRDLITR